MARSRVEWRDGVGRALFLLSKSCRDGSRIGDQRQTRRRAKGTAGRARTGERCRHGRGISCHMHGHSHENGHRDGIPDGGLSRYRNTAATQPMDQPKAKYGQAGKRRQGQTGQDQTNTQSDKGPQNKNKNKTRKTRTRQERQEQGRSKS